MQGVGACMQCDRHQRAFSKPSRSWKRLLVGVTRVLLGAKDLSGCDGNKLDIKNLHGCAFGIVLGILQHIKACLSPLHSR